MPHRVVCDCDNTMGLPGKPVDDGQALLYLLGRSDIELVGITTSFGNGTIDEVFSATQQLLCALGREDIPLFKGEGRRGQPPTDAAHFLVEITASYPGEITLLAIGPAGNLRAAAEIEPDFFRYLKQVVYMGGYLRPLELPGWDDVPEVNLSADPEATFAVLNAPCPFTLMNAHVCLQAPFGFPELEPIADFDPAAYRILRDYLVAIEERHLAPRDYLWDLLPAVYISCPDLFDDNPVWVRSTIQDLETGTIVIGEEGEGARINMPTRILDVERFYRVLYDAWAQARLTRSNGHNTHGSQA